MAMTIAPESTEPRPGGVRGRVVELRALCVQALVGPSEKTIAAQKAKGELTARERIGLLFDEGSFHEVEPLRRHRATGSGLEAERSCTDGVVTRGGTVTSRPVFVYAHDFRIFGGVPGEAHATKIHKILDLAIAAGARIQEGISALAGYGGIFRRNTKVSGVVPRISVMLGPCAGGADGHAEPSSVCRFACDDEETCIAEVRYLLPLLPQNNRENVPRVPCADPAERRGKALLDLVPAEGSRPYDMTEAIEEIEEIVDDGEYLEVRIRSQTKHADLPSREHGNPPQ